MSLLSPEAVRSLILEHVAPLAPVRAPLDRVAGCVLAEPLVAGLDLPSFSNAAMDGFAVRSADLSGGRVRLRITGRLAAGSPVPVPGGPTVGPVVGPREACVIATGAPLPEGADAVIRLEDAVAEGSWLAGGSLLAEGSLLAGEGWVEAAVVARPGLNVRWKGEDVAAGDVLAEAGTPMGPGQLAAAAAAGVTSVLVHRQPSVAIVPTGDEVTPPGLPLPPGHVYDAVSIPLTALLEEAGSTPTALPVVPDLPGAVQEAIRTAAASHDLVITVGGVSVGTRDFVGRNPRLPEVLSVSLALRPARPFAFGHIGSATVLCLPGNPGSALVAFEELVRPVVLALSGRSPRPRPVVTAVLAEPLAGKPGMLGLVACKVWADGPKDGPDGLRLMARRAGPTGSSRGTAEPIGTAGPIGGLAGANAWAVVPADRAGLPAGARIEVRLLSDIAASP